MNLDTHLIGRLHGSPPRPAHGGRHARLRRTAGQPPAGRGAAVRRASPWAAGRRTSGPWAAAGRPVAGAALATALVLLAGCSGGAVAAPGTPAAPTPTVSAAPVSTTPVTIASGSVALTLQPDASFVAAGGQVTVTDDGDGSVRATVAGAGAGAVVIGTLSAVAGSTLSVQADTSVSVLGADDAWVGGVVVDGVGAGLAELPDGSLELTAADGADLWLASQAVESLDWGTREGGRSLAVTPTPWTRSGSLAAEAGVWAAMSADPEAATATMRAQLDCHLLGARDKDTWNLEPWRPEVGAAEMITTSCNPT